MDNSKQTRDNRKEMRGGGKFGIAIEIDNRRAKSGIGDSRARPLKDKSTEKTPHLCK
jgi:hypothetical protein